MADSCSTCYFSRTFNDVTYSCHCYAPSRLVFGAAQETVWPIVGPNDWCGEGKDKNTRQPFTPPPA